MVSIGEDLLKCDMAEVYHLYITDWYNPPFPLSYLADLANGLSDDSRIKRKMANVTLTLNDTLLSLVIDKLSILIWQQTKDGHKGRNIPESLYRKLAGLDKKDELQSFESVEDFNRWYKAKMR